MGYATKAMIKDHEGLAETLAQEVELDARMIAKITEIKALYDEAGKAIARRRMISRMILTAIKHGNKPKVRQLVADWRLATKKVERFKF